MIRFDWDEQKNQQNRLKHQIWFEEAQSVFDDPWLRYIYDHEHSKMEERFIALGYSGAQRMLVVVHCYNEEESLVRIISARVATKKEREFYEKRI